MAKKEKQSVLVTVGQLPKIISMHLMGGDYNHTHHVCVGIIFMIAGVILAKVVIIFDSTVIHYAGDIVGYGMHGIGLTPIIEGMSRSGKL